MSKEEQQAFYFGSVVSKRVFLNRSEELNHLHLNFRNGIHTILISPRRWGKTSLVKRASETYKNEQTRFVFLDAFRLHSREQFLEQLANKVIKACYSESEVLLHDLRSFFSKLVPELGLSSDIQGEFNFRLKWKGEEMPADEILDLPEKLALKNNIRIVLCIDEFQNIAGFDKKQRFQKELRSYWQHHNHVLYCLYGSKRSVMNDFFNKVNMPFYRFGDVILLKKIELEHWKTYIQKRFDLFGKSIEAETAGEIASLMQCHSYYVQQLSYVVFINCEKHAGMKELGFALSVMLQQNQILYRRILDELTAAQIEYLRAMCEGVNKMYTKKAMQEYRFGTVGNIKRIKEALEQKEVIDFFEEKPAFIDPAFELWFKTYYLEQPLFVA